MTPVVLHIAAPSPSSTPRRREPIRVGIPIAAGRCADAQQAWCADMAGRRQPLGARVLDRWPDGSVRWLLVDLQADHAGGGAAAPYRIDFGNAPGGEAGPADPISVAVEARSLTIDTGAARFMLDRSGSFPISRAVVSNGVGGGAGDVPVLEVGGARFVLIAADGSSAPLAIDRLDVEESNALVAVARIDGHIAIGRSGGPTASRLQVRIRLTFHAGSTAVGCALTLHNPGRAGHAGGFWELGDAGSILFRDASLTVSLPVADGTSQVHASIDAGAPMRPRQEPFAVYQASSGGEHWQSAAHVNRDGVVPLAFRGAVVREGAETSDELRPTPVVSVTRGRARAAVTMPQFWQNFPVAIEAGVGTLVLHLFPGEHSDLHELQGGEQKTHRWTLLFGEDAVTGEPLEWVRQPLAAQAEPAYYAGTGAIPYLTPSADSPEPGYERLVNAAIEGDDSFEAKRERIDEYGWRHFGDIYADHEAVHQQGPEPLISHYNNQYDGIAGFATQFLRSGDRRWCSQLNELAAHVADIDIYRTRLDKSAYNHGLFWHTFHYVGAGRSTHRSYPRAPGVAGGGPSNEHNYAAGLMLHHFLTGDPISRETAIGLAQWVVDMDDGGGTVFRWLARGETGVASATVSPDYHGPGRGAGNSINALLVGHRLTGDARFLEKAEALIRRCIHPRDDVAARDLLDTERRWSYTVFLHALGKYLDDKAARNEIDAMYAHAQQSLLVYAAWMAEHEYPYLDRPDKLEYPTETWAAQELWKCEVFLFAARYGADADRERFLERSAFFFRYAMNQLAGMPTRTLARPMVLLLGRGHMHLFSAGREIVAAPVPAHAGPPTTPERFVPQKARALRRAKLLAAGGGLAIIVVLAALLAMVS